MSGASNVFSAGEYCDRIKYEFELLQQQNTHLKMEAEKAKSEKQNLVQLSKKYYEMAYYLNVQNHKHALINTRLLTIINDAIKLLPPDTQGFVQESLEDAKRVSVADIEKRIKILQSQPNQRAELDPMNEEILVGPTVAPSLQQQQQQQSQLPPPPSASSQQQHNVESGASKAVRVAAQEYEPIRSANVAAAAAATVGEKQDMEDVVVAPQVVADALSVAPPAPLSEERTMVDVTGSRDAADVKPEQRGSALAAVEDMKGSMVEERVTGANGAGAGAAAVLSQQGGGKRVPRRLNQRLTLPHEYSVSALSFNKAGDRIFSGSRGTVKIWNLNADYNAKPLADIDCSKSNYIRTCKMTSDEQNMLVCGEFKEIMMFDMGQGSPVLKTKMETTCDFHYGLVISQDDKYCFSCFSNGLVGMWELSSGKLVRTFKGHRDSVSCIDMASNGTTLITGGLDQMLRVWDWTTDTLLYTTELPCQIFTLGALPGSNSIVAVGLENSSVEVVDIENPKNMYDLQLHENCVLSLSFAPSGDWFITGGKDKYLNVWKAPYGPGVVRTKEQNSILSCHVSSQCDMLCTGSWEKKCTVYDVLYTD